MLHGLLAILAIQIPTYPVGRTSDGRTEVVFVDRYRLPVSQVSVEGIASRYDKDRFAEAPFGFRELETPQTDAEGRATIGLAAEECAWLVARRSGYAPTPVYPVHPGYAYEIVLDLGTTVYVQCRTAEGPSAANAELELYWKPLTDIPGHKLEWARGVQPVLHVQADSFGWAVFSHVPRGALELQGRAEGLRASSIFQVASAFGNEASYGLAPLELTFRALTTRTVRAVGEDDEPIDDPFVSYAWGPGLRVAAPTVVRANGSSVDVACDWSGIRGVLVGAAGFEPESLMDPTTGQVKASFDGTAHLKARARRRIALDLDALGLPRGSKVWLAPLDKEHPWSVLAACTSSPRRASIELPEKNDVFAVVLSGDEITGYLTCPLGGAAVAYLPAATLTITYAIDGRRPCGAILRLAPKETTPSAQRPLVYSFGLSAQPSNPDGTTVLRALLPGTYALEPHFHYSVFTDYYAELEVRPGDHVSRTIEVHRGATVCGRVIEKESGRAVTTGAVKVVPCGDGGKIYDTLYTLDASGSFLLGGLKPDATYDVLYRPNEWDGADQEGGPSGSFRLEPPFPAEITLALE